MSPRTWDSVRRASSSSSAGRKHGRGETHANRRSTQKTWNSVAENCSRQRGLNGKNGNGFFSTTQTPGHIGTSGGVPPRGNQVLPENGDSFVAQVAGNFKQ